MLRLIAIIGLSVLLAGSFSKRAFCETGFATYYTEKSCKREGTSGIWTASGEPYVESAFTCALPDRKGMYTLQLWKVTNVLNGKFVIVRQNDFGPGNGPRSKGVIIDLTPRAFKALGDLRRGKIRVRVEKA